MGVWHVAVIVNVFHVFRAQALFEVIADLEGKLETEQEKLAALERNLSGEMNPSSQESEEQAVSEDWLYSLKERRKVSSVTRVGKVHKWQCQSRAGEGLSPMGLTFQLHVQNVIEIGSALLVLFTLEIYPTDVK